MHMTTDASAAVGTFWARGLLLSFSMLRSRDGLGYDAIHAKRCNINTNNRRLMTHTRVPGLDCSSSAVERWRSSTASEGKTC